MGLEISHTEIYIQGGVCKLNFTSPTPIKTTKQQQNTPPLHIFLLFYTYISPLFNNNGYLEHLGPKITPKFTTQNTPNHYAKHPKPLQPLVNLARKTRYFM